MKNKNIIIGIISIFSFFMLLCFFTNCSGKSEEDLVLETVDKIGSSAEDANISGILGFVSNDYADEEGRSFEDIEKLLQQYFSMYRGIAVNMLGKKIIHVTPPEAEVEAEVGLSSGAAQMFRKAVRYSGYFYRFKLILVKENKQWRVKKASWENVDQGNLLPESVEALKELFPNAI